jgi:tetratricopeptide (TPR) repeat protein
MGCFFCYMDVTMKLTQFMLKAPTLAITALFCTSLQASSLEEFYQFFKSGQYPKALSALEKINVDKTNLSSKAYLAGLSYSRMQEYDKAIVQFKIAIDEKNDSVDLFYEYGQALYAANELRQSREAFKVSIDKNFNKTASLYYVAHISQILEDFDTAKNYYMMVIKDKSSDVKMKQIAHFQLGETLLSIARVKSVKNEDLTRRVDNFILPLMTRALNQDKNSELAKEITQRSTEIMVEFNLDPNLLANGRRISPKRFAGYVSQKVSHDDNISLVNEENNVQQSKKKSFIFDTEAYVKYDQILKKRFIISPEARFTYTKHSNQTDADVYQNDSFVMNFALKNRYEHKVRDLPASLIFDIDYSRTLKDWKAQKKKEFYAKATTFTIGESFSYFAIGDTTIKLKKKTYTGANEAINNHTTTLAADQTFFLPIQHLVLATFDASFIDNYNNTTSSTDAFMARIDYIIPDIKPKFTLDIALAMTLTDTKEQKLTRGTETLINPSLDLSYDLNQASSISANYDFTKSKSKDSDYSYSKHVISSEFRYAF